MLPLLAVALIKALSALFLSIDLLIRLFINAITGALAALVAASAVETVWLWSRRRANRLTFIKVSAGCGAWLATLFALSVGLQSGWREAFGAFAFAGIFLLLLLFALVGVVLSMWVARRGPNERG